MTGWTIYHIQSSPIRFLHHHWSQLTPVTTLVDCCDHGIVDGSVELANKNRIYRIKRFNLRSTFLGRHQCVAVTSEAVVWDTGKADGGTKITYKTPNLTPKRSRGFRTASLRQVICCFENCVKIMLIGSVQTRTKTTCGLKPMRKAATITAKGNKRFQ